MWDLKNNPKEPDIWGIIVGAGGKGKSNFAQAVGYDNDCSFSEKRVIFPKMEWDMMKGKLKRANIVVFDEGGDIFFSRNGMSADQKDAIQEVVKIRAMGFFVMVCIPNLRLLDWYIRAEKPHFIVKCDSPKFRLWSLMETQEQNEEEAEYKLNLILKEGLNAVPPDWEGTWKPVEGARWDKYQEKKRRYMFNEKKSDKVIKAQIKAEELRRNSWTIRDISVEKGVHIGTVHKYVEKLLPKKHTFFDAQGKKRLTMEGKRLLDRRWALEIERNKRKKRRR